MDPKRRMEWHEKVGNDARNWCISAEGLLASARVLKAEHDTFKWDDCEQTEPQPAPDAAIVMPTLLMLRGMALECLFKALWLAQGNTLVAEGNYQGVPTVGQHDLAGLAVKSNFPISEHESYLLVRLSDFITHFGRYPITRRGVDHMRFVKDPDGGGGVTGTWNYGRDELLFTELVTRLRKLLGATD